MEAVTLELVLSHIHNWFERGTTQVCNCTIDNGSLPDTVSMPDGVWYRIQGSLLNDGLHMHPDLALTDETFSGTISVCAIPRPLLAICDSIEAYMQAYANARQKASESVYQSESFGGYTYSIKGELAGNTASGGLTGWQAAFASELNPWRKIS